MRRIVFICSTVFLSAALSAQTVFFSNRCNTVLESTFTIANGTGFAPYATAGDLCLSVDFNELTCSAGMKISPQSYDITADATYWPLFLNRLNLGVKTRYHFLSYNTYFCENDVLAGIALRYRDFRTFTMTLDVDYFRKAARIDAIATAHPWLANNSIAVNTKWDWLLGDTFEFYFAISSYSYYRYYLFWAPDFTTGCFVYFQNGVGVGAEFEIQYVDMLTLTAYFDSAEIKLIAKVPL